ncbi:Glutathione S-transferase T1, partial [Linum grandiflorum]
MLVMLPEIRDLLIASFVSFYSWICFNKALEPALGRPLNPQAAEEGEKILTSSLLTLESFWLKGSGKYLLGGNHPSIADLSLMCELMQLEVMDEADRDRVLGPHKKVWLNPLLFLL